MNKVKVSKQELVEKLKENREVHIAEYTEMIQDYKSKVTKELKKILKESKNKNNWDPRTSVHLDKPRSYATEYNQIIGLLEMSVEDTFDISQEEYNKYVLNQWNWSSSFEFSKMSYLGSN